MSEFNVHKWFKNQYLKEAGIFEEEKFPMPSPSVFFAIHKILADLLDEKAVAAGDRMSYFSAEFPLSSYFESYMRKQLEGTLLSEAPGSTLNLSQADMDKLHKDGKLEIDGHKLLFNVNESLDIDFDDEKDVKDETSFYDPVHEAEGGFSELKAKLEADPDNEYLTFTDKGTQLKVDGRNGDLDDFIRKYENQDLGEYKLFFVDDEDRGWIVSISRK